MRMTAWRMVALIATFLVAGLAGCGPSSPTPPADGRTGISIRALAGPVCPVERIPPDPACAPRPVPGAEIRITTPDGQAVVSVRLDANGLATVPVAPGAYLLTALPVTGLLGTPPPQTVTVGPDGFVAVELGYDTGIR
jgi:hypothetical protein